MTNSVRYLETALLEDPFSFPKMAFLSGPRQCGKTTLAEHMLTVEECDKNYFNWDDVEFRRLWLKSPESVLPLLHLNPGQIPLLVLDEIHKHKKWKTLLKGFYDLNRKRVRILVTGSARLNVYRKSGDSLAGRYIPYRLHPFTLGEVNTLKTPPEEDWLERPGVSRFDWKDIFALGGFPEPLLSGKEAQTQRWWRLYREQLIREDLRDFKAIREVQQVDTLTTLLLDKVGGGFSFQSIQEDLSVSFATVRDWVDALESIYLCFLIRPFSKRIQGSLKKEPKIYFFHWPAVKNLGARLENLVACHLLKSVQAWTDSAVGEFGLHYIRDKSKREVDFCVVRDGKPWLLLEVKNSSRAITPALAYYTDLLKPKFSVQLLEAGAERRDQYTTGGSRIMMMGVDQFLGALN
jgi:predicted AAA+ superfamily ATPase